MIIKLNTFIIYHKLYITYIKIIYDYDDVLTTSGCDIILHLGLKLSDKNPDILTVQVKLKYTIQP